MSFKQKQNLRLAVLIACALSLQACGGGDSDSGTRAGLPVTETAATGQGDGVTGLIGVDGNRGAGLATAKGFRFSMDEMVDIANPDKLARRMFYDQPSTGPDAEWFDAIKRGDTIRVRQMVEAGQNLEARDEASLGQTALGWAAFIGYEDIVDYLLEKGASVHATDRGDVYNVLKSAALGKNVNIVRKIHQRLPETDFNDQTIEADGETLIMVAASNNRLEVVKYLIEQGSNVNLVATTKDKSLGAYDQGPLSYACTRNHPEMVKLLVAHGAINHRNGKPACD
ncbi:MAG: ankyrin repeat domain-containing protein [Lautropia sp.]|nr:ankyrin repeat domain-containing protein [Lautropia sp.]